MGSVELLSRQMMIAWKLSGLSHRPAIIASRPASMRLATAISPSRESSSTEPISRRYMRTGSSVRSDGSAFSTLASAVSARDGLGRAALAPDDDRLEAQRALAQAGDHRLAAGLDALGDRDLALAREQLDRAHLAQIHAYGVVGALGRFCLLDLGQRSICARWARSSCSRAR